ncbi:trans-aconitate 2-methyltransferase [bacterium BMS3Abin10]|nr:trans-aconitate 2-methyltransferase [bacterium BMS3Abin10]GBE38617.1 trans-aconitate 2-methyltransferase [bacterium BMS3Bbin08]
MRWDAEKYDTVKAPQVDAGRELIVMAEVRETNSILDIGCGTGKLTAELARLASKGFVTGIDPSKEMLDKARRTCESFKNTSFRLISAQSMSFTDEFDLVFSNSALHWIKEQHEVIGLAYQCLKDDGRIAFQLPARNFCSEFYEYSSNAIDLLGLRETFKDWETPWYFPIREEYKILLESVGFYNIKIYYRDYGLLFKNINDVLDWWSSAGLRPFLARLPEREREYFKYAFAMSFENNRTEKGIEFNFRRLFVFADK